MSERKQIGICIIATRKYKQFLPELLFQISINFLEKHRLKVFLFLDDLSTVYELGERIDVIRKEIPAYKFPYATLYRYKIFNENKDELSKCSHLIYMDVDMGIVGEVGDEFITDTLIAVRHPGMYKKDGWGDGSNPIESKSYLPTELRKHYYCGGVQGGASHLYLQAARQMANGIAEDEAKGIKAEHNDETFWNHYIHTSGVPITEFTPSYCMVEEPELRVAWGIDDLPVKIIALAKDHDKIRS